MDHLCSDTRSRVSIVGKGDSGMRPLTGGGTLSSRSRRLSTNLLVFPFNPEGENKYPVNFYVLLHVSFDSSESIVPRGRMMLSQFNSCPYKARNPSGGLRATCPRGFFVPGLLCPRFFIVLEHPFEERKTWSFRVRSLS